MRVVSVSCPCGMLNGGGVCCCPAQPGVCGLACTPPPRCVVGTAVMSCCCLVAGWCGVMGEYLSGSLCGGVSSVALPPLPSWWGVCCGGGWQCRWCPRLLLVSPSAVGVLLLLSTLRLLLNGVACVLWCPLCWVGCLHVVLSCLCCLVSPLCCVLWVVCVVFFSSSLPLFPFLSLCLLSQYCWFSVVFCDRVVSLWSSGVGLSVAEGRVVWWCGGVFSFCVCWWGMVSAVCCLLSTRHPWCGVCLACCVMVVRVLSCLVVLGCGMAVGCDGVWSQFSSLFLAFLFCLVFVFFVFFVFLCCWCSG